MKKHFLSLLIFFLALPAIWANNIYYNITQENSVAQIQTDLQALINNATGGDTIVVTGNKTDADVSLQLNISSGKVVKWQATYQSETSFNAGALIHFFGNGTFEIAGGALTTGANNAILSEGTNATVKVSSGSLNSTEGETIKTTGTNAIVSISGGTVSATIENAVLAKGTNAKVFVSGGTVRNATDDSYPVIFINVSDNTGLNVIISGTGIVEATMDGYAIWTNGIVEVKDHAWVSAIVFPAILSRNAAIISGMCTVAGVGHTTIDSQNVEIKDQAQIITERGSCIRAQNVEIKDQAQVINKKGDCAITASQEVKVSGGLVYAQNSDITKIIDCFNFSGVTGTGMLLAWNKNAGNTNYEMFSTNDILKLPESATAYWDTKESEDGIFYANGENTGFIPLEVTVELSISDPISSNLTAYPNPVSNILHIETQDNCTIPEVHIYSIQGVLLIHEIGNRIDVSSLPCGIFIAKVNGVCLKIVKL